MSRHKWMDVTKQKYKRLSIRAKMMLSLVFIIVFISVFISIYYYNRTTEYVRNSQIKNFVELMNQTQISLDNMLSSVEDTTKSIVLNETLEGILLRSESSRPYSLSEQIEDYIYLSKYISVANVNSAIELVRLYFINNSIYTREKLRFFHVSEAEKKSWYERTVFTDGAPVWEHGDEEITCARAILHYDLAKSDCGFIEVVLNRKSLYKVLDNVRFTSQGEICLVDDFGNIFVSRGDEAFADFVANHLDLLREGANRDDPVLGLENNQTIVSRRLSNNWLMVASQSHHAAQVEIRSISLDIFYICFLAIVFATLFVFLLVLGIANRIKRIADFMSTVSISSNDYAPEEYEDELSTVERSFNQMLLTARKSVAKEKEAQRKKEEADFDILQEQINPHFLYNCLDSINWMAIESHTPEISNMIQLLSKFFRLGLSKRNQIIPLSDEIEHVKLYVEIVCIRYDSNIEMDYHLEVNPYLTSTLKFILQPLVENAIVHGIACRPDQIGHIQITCRHQAQELIVSVSDDGIGIPDEKLERLQRDILLGSQNAGFGLYNVNQRIQLHFGKPYGLVLESQYEQGTIVTIHLPWMLK